MNGQLLGALLQVDMEAKQLPTLSKSPSCYGFQLELWFPTDVADQLIVVQPLLSLFQGEKKKLNS